MQRVRNRFALCGCVWSSPAVASCAMSASTPTVGSIPISTVLSTMAASAEPPHAAIMVLCECAAIGNFQKLTRKRSKNHRFLHLFSCTECITVTMTSSPLQNVFQLNQSAYWRYRFNFSWPGNCPKRERSAFELFLGAVVRLCCIFFRVVPTSPGVILDGHVCSRSQHVRSVHCALSAQPRSACAVPDTTATHV